MMRETTAMNPKLLLASGLAIVLLVAGHYRYHVHDKRRYIATHRRLSVLQADDSFVTKSKENHLPLFDTSDTFTTLGPTVFPKPTYIYERDDDDEDETTTTKTRGDVVTYLGPTSGSHRPSKDSVFAFCTEYNFDYFLLFLMSLHETGYDGDVVVGISQIDWNNPDIRQLLELWQNPSAHGNQMVVVVYVVPYHCYNVEGEIKNSHKGGMRVCQCNNMYGFRKPGETNSTKPLLDKRHGRTAQTIRYELYWIWSEHYNPNSWILLIDARDTIFQQPPFNTVPRRSSEQKSGTLFFFGENADVTSLSKSKYNRKWLVLAYGEQVANSFAKKPTICSGSTMGEQAAIETYLRAQVAESDESKTVIFGADQGFHNYLYYSDKLANAKGISRIVVQDQGLGIVNNVGALREEDLTKWGNGKLLDPNTKIVHNFDGSISPVVHQYDRDKTLSNYWRSTKKKEFVTKWKTMKKRKT